MDRIIIDTNLSIKIIKGNPQVVRWFRSVEGKPTFPCFIIMELFAGCNSNEDRDGLKTKIIERFGVYWPDDKVIIRAYRLVMSDQNLARRLKVADALIAACAMELHARLYTDDNDFANVPGLKKYSPEILP